MSICHARLACSFSPQRPPPARTSSSHPPPANSPWLSSPHLQPLLLLCTSAEDTCLTQTGHHISTATHWRMLLSGLLCATLALLPLGVSADLDDDMKMANRTIERVRYVFGRVVALTWRTCHRSVVCACTLCILCTFRLCRTRVPCAVHPRALLGATSGSLNGADMLFPFTDSLPSNALNIPSLHRPGPAKQVRFHHCNPALCTHLVHRERAIDGGTLVPTPSSCVLAILSPPLETHVHT